MSEKSRRSADVKSQTPPPPKLITLYTVPLIPKEIHEEFIREAAAAKVILTPFRIDSAGGTNSIGTPTEFFTASAKRPNLIWATDVSRLAFEVEIPSISGGAKNLRAALAAALPDLKGIRWVLLPGNHHRRASLIAEELRAITPEPLEFPKDAETPWEMKNPTVGFFLLTADRAIALFDHLTPLPGGGTDFREEKVGPPSRAYLKIWEALTRVARETGKLPQSGDITVDLGSCPGGWTWALAQLGCICLSVDGAPIEPSVAKMPGVRFLKKDAFKLSPEEVCEELGVAKIDWVFSDMICEPKRLPGLLKTWLDSGVCENFVISVKFKGEADLKALRELDRLGGGMLRHLRQNKHEVTWFRVPGLTKI